MTDKKAKSTSIKKPKFVLTDETKFYLATKDISNEESDLFFIASLFLPAKKGTIYLQPFTEIATFDDAESATIYYETVSKMAEVHKATEGGYGIHAEIVKKFLEHTK